MSTKIEWTDETWNPITGCTPISAGCKNCYAKRMSNRLAGRFGYPQDDPFRPGTFHEDKLEQPLHWRKPRKIFVCSMGDLFHPTVKYEHINKIFEIMGISHYFNLSQHIFQILTKYPDNLLRFMDHYGKKGKCILEFDSLIWVGVSVENQKTALKRVPALKNIPAAIKYISFEPLLSEIEISDHIMREIDWVIVGGESGPGARPIHPNWVIDIQKECQMTKTPFFFKQWGEWLPDDQIDQSEMVCKKGHPGAPPWALDKPVCHLSPGLHAFRVGKKKAGRKLNGKKYNEFPLVKFPG